MRGTAWPLRHGGQLRVGQFHGVVIVERNDKLFRPGPPPTHGWRQLLSLSVAEALALHASLVAPITIAEEHLAAVLDPVIRPGWAFDGAVSVVDGRVVGVEQRA